MLAVGGLVLPGPIRPAPHCQLRRRRPTGALDAPRGGSAPWTGGRVLGILTARLAAISLSNDRGAGSFVPFRDPGAGREATQLAPRLRRRERRRARSVCPSSLPAAGRCARAELLSTVRAPKRKDVLAVDPGRETPRPQLLSSQPFERVLDDRAARDASLAQQGGGEAWPFGSIFVRPSFRGGSAGTRSWGGLLVT
jgi:hypothetical protein